MAPGIAVTNENGCSWTKVSPLDRLRGNMARETILKEHQSLREHDLLVDHRHNEHDHSKQIALQASLSLLSDKEPLGMLLRNGGEVLQTIAGGLNPSTGCEKSILAMVSVLDAAGITASDFLSSTLAQLKNTSTIYAGTLIGKALLELLLKPSRCFEAASSWCLPAFSASCALAEALMHSD